MEKEKEEGGIILMTPFGVMPRDTELQDIINAIPKDSKNYFKRWAKAVDAWEKRRVAGYIEREKTAKSASFDNAMRRR
jgi:hypothetical protein